MFLLVNFLRTRQTTIDHFLTGFVVVQAFAGTQLGQEIDEGRVVDAALPMKINIYIYININSLHSLLLVFFCRWEMFSIA